MLPATLCILCVCKDCKNFPKLDELNIPAMKCSKSCLKVNEDCKAQKHTITFKQYDRVTYTHKGQEKKKLALVDKSVTGEELVQLLKDKMKQFPLHRFNVQNTAKTYEKLVANLTENTIFTPKKGFFWAFGLKIFNFPLKKTPTCYIPLERKFYVEFKYQSFRLKNATRNDLLCFNP